jgi:hypothetical protein
LKVLFPVFCFLLEMMVMKVFLGFDPGGEGHFGWAVCLDSDDGLRVIDAGIADHAKGAMEQSLKALPKGASVAGAGIDAPMFWVMDGGRKVDYLLRSAIGLLGATSPGGTVQHFNSLRGACVIQGLLILKLLRLEYPKSTNNRGSSQSIALVDGYSPKRS